MPRLLHFQCMLPSMCGLLAQLVERLLCKQDVMGSSPIRSTAPRCCTTVRMFHSNSCVTCGGLLRCRCEVLGFWHVELKHLNEVLLAGFLRFYPRWELLVGFL